MENASPQIMENAPPQKWNFLNFLSNCGCNTGLFLTVLPFITVYICCCLCFLTLVKRLHYRFNLTENFKNYTFWGWIFWNFPSNCAYNKAFFFDFFYNLLQYIFFLTLGKCIHYSCNLTENFRNSTFWESNFLNFSSNFTYNSGLHFNFFCYVL